MSCCTPASTAPDLPHAVQLAREELLAASRRLDTGTWQTDLSVPGIHCGGCVHSIESGLGTLAGVRQARVNLSTRRVSVRWDATGAPPPLRETLRDLGYEAHLHDGAAEPKDAILASLVRALAVAGFAAGNIMMLSMGVWAGAEGGMRDLLHAVSAAIALPALLYSGRVFFRSAWAALRQRRTNMDVPISIGVLLAFGISLYDTLTHGPHAYFDAAISLLFFLLVGRTLDHVMRRKAQVAVQGLARLAARGAIVRQADGTVGYVPVDDIVPGMTVLVAAGERVPVDARVESGRSDVDMSLVSGESRPQAAAPGTPLLAGVLNLTAPLALTASAAARDSFLAEMVRLMEAAEAGRSAWRRIADRAAQLYAPVVHATALLAFAGWMFAGRDLYDAITIAIAVLIVTCPCALGLAVPMVQVMAARRLFEAGIMVKDGSGLERLAGIDTVVLDKTGTLTAGELCLANPHEVDPAALAMATAMAAHSRHPHCRALLRTAGSARAVPVFDCIVEHPGLGLEAVTDGTVWRLGRAAWGGHGEATPAADGTVLSANGHVRAVLRFEDRLRDGATAALAELRAQDLDLEILSGDDAAAVAALARQVGVAAWRAGVLPADKTAHLAALAARGRKVLMVGDGLNDAPALAAAHVSMAPASAADIGRQAADFVFLRHSLEAVPMAIDVARRSARLIRQNFALAIAYNAVAIPVAVCGLLTPLVAALAMSLSSILVVANALRLGGGAPRPAQVAPEAPVVRPRAVPAE